MKKSGLFLLLLISISSCNGQIKADLPIGTATKSAGQSKLIKTLGTNRYNNVGCGLQDKAGNLWFGTKGEGLYCYDGKSFTNYTEKDGLSSNFIWSIIEDNTGKLWFGTADGISCYSPSAQLLTGGSKFTIIPISTITGGTPDRKTTPDDFGMPHPEENSVWTILQDKKGIFWFGTTAGIYRYDPSALPEAGGKSYTHFLHDDGVINNTGVTINSAHAFGVEHILEDKKGNIWFGGRGTQGLFFYDGKTLSNFKPDGEHWFWPLLQDKAGNIWFSNWWGIFSYGPSATLSEGEKIFTNLTKKDDLCPSFATCIMEDKNGNIWIGSDTENDNKIGGLSCFNPSASLTTNEKSFTHFTTKEGLPDNSVWSITEDRLGNLWIGTRNTGLCRYDPSATLKASPSDSFKAGGKIFTIFSE